MARELFGTFHLVLCKVEPMSDPKLRIRFAKDSPGFGSRIESAAPGSFQPLLGTTILAYWLRGSQDMRQR